MNVFMGYNPLVAKQVKVSVWVKEIDGAEPILPATPKDGDCFIVFDTDDDVLADNPSLKKSYANGSWGDAGGGGTSFPTFAKTGGSWTCDMTYEEAKVVHDSEKGDSVPSCPCHKSVNGASNWDMMSYATREQMASVVFDPPLPEDLIGGLTFGSLTFGNLIVYGNDGNFYERVS